MNILVLNNSRNTMLLSILCLIYTFHNHPHIREAWISIMDVIIVINLLITLKQMSK